VAEKKKTKSNLKIRKYADFFPEKSSLDKELLDIFFNESGFQHDALGLTPLSATETIKSALIYFKKNVLDYGLSKENIKQDSIGPSSKKEIVLNLE